MIDVHVRRAACFLVRIRRNVRISVSVAEYSGHYMSPAMTDNPRHFNPRRPKSVCSRQL